MGDPWHSAFNGANHLGTAVAIHVEHMHLMYTLTNCKVYSYTQIRRIVLCSTVVHMYMCTQMLTLY